MLHRSFTYSYISYIPTTVSPCEDLAHGITQASLHTVKLSLSAAGAQEGELLRLALGDEAAEAVILVLQMVRRFCEPLTGVSSSAPRILKCYLYRFR